MTATIATESTTQQFYELLEPETRVFVRQKTSEIKSLLRVCWSEVAHRAIEVKNEIDHGLFLSWIELEIQPEFGISERTLRLMMAAVRELGSKTENFADLPIQKSAAYELTGAPREAQREAIDRAQNGETVTRAKAKEIIARHQPGDSISYQGETLEVVVSDDVTVQARNQAGQPVTLLTAELLPDDLGVAVPPPIAPARPAPIEALSLRLESAEARIVLLENWIRVAVPYAPPHLQQQAYSLLS